MRTLFEDVDERADREDDQKGNKSHRILWFVAILSLAGAYGTYYSITHRTSSITSPPPISLTDDSQLNQVVNRFNGFLKAGNWDEAQKMISAEGLKRLENEGLTLRESLLGKRKDQQIIEALLTESRSHTPSTARLDCAYLFSDRQTMIVPLTLVIENGQLMINSW